MSNEFAEIYDELRALAGRFFKRRVGGHTLQPTALVHEAYLKLAASPGPARDRAHFLAVAATAMRQILVDHARRGQAQKRGGGAPRITLTDHEAGGGRPIDLLVLDDLLHRLARANEQQARIVELRCFGGQTNPEVAQTLGMSVRSVERHWRFARAWLEDQLGAVS